MANDKNTLAPVVAPAPLTTTEESRRAADRREAEINAFLDEFAHNDNRRRTLREAIETGAHVESDSKYFQSRLKKVQNK